jgi:hypothetical protein
MRRPGVELGETEHCCTGSRVPHLESVLEGMPLVLVAHLNRSDNEIKINVIIEEIKRKLSTMTRSMGSQTEI